MSDESENDFDGDGQEEEQQVNEDEAGLGFLPLPWEEMGIYRGRNWEETPTGHGGRDNNQPIWSEFSTLATGM